jgi:transcription-repair coupling factor (superfamily II helicase)
MDLRSLPPLLRDEPALRRVLGRSAAVLAVPEAARAVTAAGVAHLSARRPLVIVCPTGTQAGALADDLVLYLGAGEVELFPAWETLPFERVSPSVETMGRRLRVLWRLRSPERMPAVVVTSARALSQRLGPHADAVVDGAAAPLVVRPGDVLDPDEALMRLVAAGYRREDVVEHRGEVARRGSIIDVFPSTADVPVRIDLWGDEVDRLTEFSVNDQRSTRDLKEAAIFPARELLPTDEVRARAEELVGAEPWGREHWERLAQGLTFDGMESWLPWLTAEERTLFDALPATALAWLVEPKRLRDRAGDVLAEEADLARTLSATWGAAQERFPSLHLPIDEVLARSSVGAWSVTTVPEGPDTPVVAASGWAPAVGGGESFAVRIRSLLGEGFRVTVCADGAGSAARLAGALREQGVDLPVHDSALDHVDLTRPGGRIVVAPLQAGFVLNDVKLACVTEADITGRRRAHRRPRTRRATDAASVFADLTPGAFVVHYVHGVGRYGGMVRRTIGGVERDYLLLEYKGGDKLYVPSDQVDAIRHYVGGEAPTLNKMGGADFERTKSRVRSEVRKIAQELVVLYQKRVNATGHAFAPDTVWQRELEDAFPYVETPDQLRAITEVKTDMESEHPMDRLVIGDVGFGKTEVAVRAAFKAVQDGKQVAVLVPTTLLAQQHFQTFSERFAGFPVRVEVMSRFLTAAQQKRVAEAVERGEVDVLVGTHRLLSADVRFKDLGLLIVDEEQRFGVGHKEAMKHLKANIDVLTLTATPVPRTMEMSLTGIRDMTLLQTPPSDRQPILTYVGPYDERAVAEAIRRELLREGQVFFVHNRVLDIEKKAAELRALIPETRIAVAHGQMDESALEQVVYDFWQGAFDVLVCTTIIESGIDMPTVNTLVVERADLLGLGQLHQLRGRVGRSGQRAYAYLFHPADVSLSEDAYERLRTIGEATELGSGFKIAMRDLEIRGAGNILGESQSGHIAAVGYDLYCQMVTEAVAELKGEPVETPAEVKLDIPVDAHLPADYVTKEELRLEAYRRLAAVRTEAEVADVKAEWEDRYGPIPVPAQRLLDIGLLRAECHRLGIREVMVAAGALRMNGLALRTSETIRLGRLFRAAVYKADLEQLQLPLPRGAEPATFAVQSLRTLRPPDGAEPVEPPPFTAGATVRSSTRPAGGPRR